MFNFMPFGFNCGNLLGGPGILGVLQNFMSSGIIESVVSAGGFKADMYETADDYFIGANVAGVNSEDININEKNKYITISIVKRSQNQRNIGGISANQTFVGQMVKTFHVEKGNIELMKIGVFNGIMLIRIPKNTNYLGTTDVKLIESNSRSLMDNNNKRLIGQNESK